MERKLNLGFGYPAMIAVSPSKQVFATMRGSFSFEGANEFLTKVTSGALPVDPLPVGGIEIRKADKWDGKDAAPIVEDDYFCFRISFSESRNEIISEKFEFHTLGIRMRLPKPSM